MKKDIQIPKVEDVYIAAVQEWNDDFMDKVWYVYLINNSQNTLENVMVVSKAFGTIDGEMKQSSMLRHAFISIPGETAVKVELVDEQVLPLNNEFMVTFFIGNTLYDKKYTFKKNSINEHATVEIPILWKPGVLLK